MISADDFMLPANALGYNFYTGVPCSFLTPFINRAISSKKIDYIGAASEGEAVAIAAGAWLAGRKTVVMCQNSGLGNCVNPITSLNHPFQIPTLLITTWRGQPGVKDEPQHLLMGQISQPLLELMRVNCLPFPVSPQEIAKTLRIAESAITENNLPFGLIMKKDTIKLETLDQPTPEIREAGLFKDFQTGFINSNRYEMLEKVIEISPNNAAIIATTGKCGRELFTIADRPQHIYQVGSMGGASAMGLGVALNTNKLVIVLDGDGSALMKMGNLATIGANAPKNLIHIILDNGVHDSTGGQATVSPHINFAKIALSCGYRFAWASDSLSSFAKAYIEALKKSGPSLIHTKICPGSIKNLGRPELSPATVARRFKTFIAGP